MSNPFFEGKQMNEEDYLMYLLHQMKHADVCWGPI